MSVRFRARHHSLSSLRVTMCIALCGVIFAANICEDSNWNEDNSYQDYLPSFSVQGAKGVGKFVLGFDLTDVVDDVKDDSDVVGCMLELSVNGTREAAGRLGSLNGQISSQTSPEGQQLVQVVMVNKAGVPIAHSSSWTDWSVPAMERLEWHEARQLLETTVAHSLTKRHDSTGIDDGEEDGPLDPSSVKALGAKNTVNVYRLGEMFGDAHTNTAVVMKLTTEMGLNVATEVLVEDGYGVRFLLPALLARANRGLPITVVDIGAHEGSFALLLAKLVPTCRVIAVEPNPETCGILRSNIERNGLDDRITVVNAAISGGGDASSDGHDVRFVRNIEASSVSQVLDSRYDQGTYLREHPDLDVIELTTMPYARLMRDYVHVDDDDDHGNGAGDVTLLKLDCEGCEVDVLPDPLFWESQSLLAQQACIAMGSSSGSCATMNGSEGDETGMCGLGCSGRMVVGELHPLPPLWGPSRVHHIAALKRLWSLAAGPHVSSMCDHLGTLDETCYFVGGEASKLEGSNATSDVTSDATTTLTTP